MRAAAWEGNRWRAGRATGPAHPRRRCDGRLLTSGLARLAAAGYEHYEISNWALPGFRSRHNLKYWRREPYFGFGAGAHSFDGRGRWANAHDPTAYVAAIRAGHRLRNRAGEVVTRAQALEEEMFLGLRQLEGNRSCAHRETIRREPEAAHRKHCAQGYWRSKVRGCASRQASLRCPTKCSWHCWTECDEN